MAPRYQQTLLPTMILSQWDDLRWALQGPNGGNPVHTVTKSTFPDATAEWTFRTSEPNPGYPRDGPPTLYNNNTVCNSDVNLYPACCTYYAYKDDNNILNNLEGSPYDQCVCCSPTIEVSGTDNTIRIVPENQP